MKIREQKKKGFNMSSPAERETLLLSAGNDVDYLKRRFGNTIWVLHGRNGIAATNDPSQPDGVCPMVFLRADDAVERNSLLPETRPLKTHWDEFLHGWEKAEIAFALDGPRELVLPYAPIEYFMENEHVEPSQIRKEHLKFGIETIKRIRNRHPKAKISIWTPFTFAAAQNISVPEDYLPDFSIPHIVVLAHPYSTAPDRQGTYGFYLDEEGQGWFVDQQGDSPAIEGSVDFMCRLVGFMNSPIAVLERVQGKAGRSGNRTSDKERPEIVVVQKRSMKYIGPTKFSGLPGPRVNPRFEFNVRSHVRHQPLRRFGKDENGKWKVVIDRVIPAQVRCKGKAKPTVVTKVCR